MRSLILTIALLVAVAVPTVAQQIPQPTGPVTFCGTQALPTADTYTVSVDGGAAQALTMSASVDARCPGGTSHSFTLPATLFPIGNHSVQVTAINQFGSTAGPTYSVTVGIAPGAFTITAVLPPAGE